MKQLRKFLVFMAKMSLLTIKFHSGDISLRDGPRPECSTDFDQDSLRKLVECNPYKGMQKLAFNLNISLSTIRYHLETIEKVSKVGVWVPFTLCEKNKEDCVYIVSLCICNFLYFLCAVHTYLSEKGAFWSSFKAVK